MAERETQRVREVEARQRDIYELTLEYEANKRRRALQGRVIIRGSEIPWEQGRQAKIKCYLQHPFIDDTAVQGWTLFVQDVLSHSGKHRHQGGLAIYVLEGKGWTVVDGVRYDWEEGDLILLPLKPNGVEHQHFNAEPGKSCKWLAMIFSAWKDALGNPFEQVESSPDWKART